MISHGNYEQAYVLIKQLKSQSNYIEVNLASPLIEIGSGLKDINLIKEGIDILEKWLAQANNKRSLVRINYNLANGYMSLYEQLKSINKWDITTLPGNKDLQKAKKCLRDARNLILFAEKAQQPKILTNYGNCLDNLGRSLEALKIYDEALKIAPNFNMALGNKAIAIKQFAAIAGVFRGAIYIEAYQILRKIINDPQVINTCTISAKNSFEKEMKNIEGRIEDKTMLSVDLTHESYSNNGLSDFEKFYLEFCSKNNLFLHLHILDSTCDAAVVDSVFINTLMLEGKNERFLELSKTINQIKEDFMIARLLLVESLYKRSEFRQLSKRTTLVNTKDNSVFHIYAGLLKTTFRLAYNILDKIAFFINDYVELRMNEKHIYFSNIWELNNKIKEQLLNTKNQSLYALYDVYLDFKPNGYFERLKQIRHCLVHRKLILFSDEKTSYDKPDDHSHIGWNTMVNKTIELMYLVKSAIIYLINFVEIEERKKLKKYKDIQIKRVKPDTTQML